MSSSTVVPPPPADLSVSLPAGGVLHLQTPDEVQFWKESAEKYSQEYALMKQNDLVTLGLLLQQQIIIYRCQMAVNGMEAETDANDVPTGRYRRVRIDAADLSTFQGTMTRASQEMRALEKQLGIDKATREKGGKHTVDSYIRASKSAGHTMGVHIAKRVLEYERVFNEARVRLRILKNGDEQDMAYHNITKATIIRWLWDECQRLEDVDKKFAKEKGKLFVGKL